MLALFALTFVAACGDDDSTEPDPGDDWPPAFIRDVYGGTELLSTGSGCWEGTCIDMAGLPTNVDPLPMTPGQRVGIAFPAGFPTAFTVNWYRAPAFVPEPLDDMRLWVELMQEPPVATGTTAPAALGEYVMFVSAEWEDHGSITYGLYAEVLNLPTPTAAP